MKFEYWRQNRIAERDQFLDRFLIKVKQGKETFKWIGLLRVAFNINHCRITETQLLPGHEINSFFVGSTWLLNISKWQPIPLSPSRASPAKKNIRNKTRRNRTNKEKTAGLLDVILELRSSKSTLLCRCRCGYMQFCSAVNIQ